MEKNNKQVNQELPTPCIEMLGNECIPEKKLPQFYGAYPIGPVGLPFDNFPLPCAVVCTRRAE